MKDLISFLHEQLGFYTPSAPNNGCLGLSENSVPLHPMVNDHYPY